MIFHIFHGSTLHKLITQELREPLAMQPNQTGDRRLWHVTVQINASTIVGGPGGKVWSLIGFYHLNTYIHTYIHTYIYIYIYAQRFPIPKQMLMQRHKIPMGKTTKVVGNIKLPPPLNLKFLWEKQQRY